MRTTVESQTFSVRLLSPEGLMAAENVTMLGASTVEGEISILKDHVPLITCLQAGLVSFYKTEKTVDQYFVADGFLEVSESTSILVEEAVLVKDMDASQIEEGLALLEKQYKHSENEAQKDAFKSDKQILKAKLELLQRLKK